MRSSRVSPVGGRRTTQSFDRSYGPGRLLHEHSKNQHPNQHRRSKSTQRHRPLDAILPPRHCNQTAQWHADLESRRVFGQNSKWAQKGDYPKRTRSRERCESEREKGRSARSVGTGAIARLVGVSIRPRFLIRRDLLLTSRRNVRFVHPSLPAPQCLALLRRVLRLSSFEGGLLLRLSVGGSSSMPSMMASMNMGRIDGMLCCDCVAPGGRSSITSAHVSCAHGKLLEEFK